MMSPNDFFQKQILFVNSSQAANNKLRFKNSNVVLYEDEKIVNQIFCHKLFSLFILGNTTITSQLIENSSRHGISLFFLKDNLEQYASINSQAEGNFLLREKQYQFFDSADSVSLAQKIVQNKINNQLLLLRKTRKIAKEDYLALKKKYKEKIKGTRDKKALLGLEGNAAKFYFKTLFGDQKWYRRLPRTKVDITNLLLDIGYTYLFNYVDAIIGLYGFDKYKGFYHTQFFQRKSLTCDLVEPFRPIIDKEILKAYNLNQVNEKDFKKTNGRYWLKYKKSKSYTRFLLKAILKNKMEIYSYIRDFYRHVQDNRHPFPDFKIK